MKKGKKTNVYSKKKKPKQCNVIENGEKGCYEIKGKICKISLLRQNCTQKIPFSLLAFLYTIFDIGTKLTCTCTL